MRFDVGCKMSRSTPPSRILRVYTEAFMGFSHVYHPEGLNNILLSQGCTLENSTHCGKGGQKIHSKDQERIRSLQLPVSRLRVNCQSCSLDDILQQLVIKIHGRAWIQS